MKVVQDSHRRYLARNARQLSLTLGRKVTERDVLGALLDMAIADEEIYDPKDSRPVSAERRAIIQAEKAGRSQAFGAEEILRRLK